MFTQKKDPSTARNAATKPRLRVILEVIESLFTQKKDPSTARNATTKPRLSLILEGIESLFTLEKKDPSTLTAQNAAIKARLKVFLLHI